MTTRFVGKDRFIRRLKKIPQKLRENAREALEQSARELVAFQKRVVPVRTGRLRDAIRYDWGTAKGAGGAIVGPSSAARARETITITVHIGKEARFYAHLVEFGASSHPNKGIFSGTENPGSPAQPFFYPPYRASKKRIKSRMRRGLKKAVADSAK